MTQALAWCKFLSSRPVAPRLAYVSTSELLEKRASARRSGLCTFQGPHASPDAGKKQQQQNNYVGLQHDSADDARCRGDAPPSSEAQDDSTLSRPDYSAENDDVTYDIQYVDSTGPDNTETCTSEVSLFIDIITGVIQNNRLIAFS